MSRTRKSKNFLAGPKAIQAAIWRSAERRRVRERLHAQKHDYDSRDIPDYCGEPDCPDCSTLFAADAGPTTEQPFDHWSYD